MPAPDNILETYPFLRYEQTTALIDREVFEQSENRPMLSKVWTGGEAVAGLAGTGTPFTTQTPRGTLRLHWDEYIGTRGKSRPVVHGAGPIKLGYSRIKERVADMFEIHLVKPINVEGLRNLRNLGTMTEGKGEDFVRREIRGEVTVALNTMEATLWQIMVQGTATLGLATTLEQQPAATFASGLNALVANTAPWGEPSTDLAFNEIPIRVQKPYMAKTGFLPGDIICSETVKAAIGKNAFVQDQMIHQGNSTVAVVQPMQNILWPGDHFAVAGQPFWNVKWIGTQEDGDTTTTEHIKGGLTVDDAVLVLPPDAQRRECFRIWSAEIPVQTGWSEAGWKPAGPVLYALLENENGTPVWNWHFRWVFLPAVMCPDWYMRYETKADEVP